MKFDTSEFGIRQLISEGETRQVEFKRRLPPGNILSRVLNAFANGDGGILLLGVDEQKGAVGVPDQDVPETLRSLERAAEALQPLPITVNATRIGNKWIPYAIVDSAPPYLRPMRTPEGHVFKRRGSGVAQQQAPESKTELTRGGSQPCRVFVAMSFREAEEPALVDYYHALKRAAERTKLPIEVVRMDELDGDYEISQRILDEIDQADVVVADFTLRSHNVYLELGYARGRGKRILQTARHGTDLEFDVRNWRTSFYQNATELEEVAISELKSAYQDVTREKVAETS